MISRRAVVGGLGLSGVAMAAPGNAASAPGADAPAIADSGLYTQPWFIDTFLVLQEDLEEAAGQGKHFAVLIEQRGCPYCEEMHRVNFGDPEISEFVSTNFNILQFDMWGSRRVTDFDGTEHEERALARRWRVSGTPSFIFFPNDPEATRGKPGHEAEIWRMLGYWKPFHFQSTFEYVRDGSYATTHFQRYLQVKVERLREQGKDVNIY